MMTDQSWYLIMGVWAVAVVLFVVWAWREVKKADKKAESENHSWEALMEEVGQAIERKYKAQGLPLSDLPERIRKDEEESEPFMLDTDEPPFPLPPTPKRVA